ncbi:MULTISPECIES: STAS domain-containing protein [Pontibacillus]|uniref:STAS domain-containing protein n=1 Tax=Pontibacillus chungwhensis TaxID=265426 RepID=A0ABY8V0P9_9BACI|nr:MULTISPECIES: STAS domain-containing protein [Pontibacillus]MCD5324384.1 STAS domain-containing protein [Pontibacillus sp. HN14]WIF99319.1 STAS domain-containing protein [Pontibacillus chungwhensis]
MNDKKVERAISSTILEQKERLVQEAALPNDIGGDIADQLMDWRRQLINAYAESVTQGADGVIDELEEWSKHVSERLVELMLPLDIALDEISKYREVIGTLIKEEAELQQFSIADFYQLVTNFNNAVDQAVQLVSRSYMEDYKDTIQKAHYAINELSIPMVRITEEVGVIPIVGEIDTYRAQLLMDNALKQGEEFRLTTVIIDLSGVSIIDTMVAHQLFKVIHSLELIGVRGVLSGIRPDIAQTMVNLGINMKTVDTFSSLHKAIGSIH